MIGRDGIEFSNYPDWWKRASSQVKGLNGLNNDGKFKGEIDNMKTNFALSPRFPESDK